MPQQLGVHNPQIARVRTLLTSKGRKAEQHFLFEGPTLLEEALASPLTIEAVYVTEEALKKEAILKQIPDERLFIVAPPVMAKISDVESPTGIVAVAETPTHSGTALLAGAGHLVLLAGLNDPGNVGTLVRTAEAFGLRGMLVLEGGADPFQPKAVRAAMGAAFRLPIVIISAENLGTHLGDRPFIAAARGGVPLPNYRFLPRSLVAIGHERHGLTAGLPQPAATIAIPHKGPTESLNAAIAGSIVLYSLSCQ
jgi:TrmH family RNA methyltransferase